MYRGMSSPCSVFWFLDWIQPTECPEVKVVHSLEKDKFALFFVVFFFFFFFFFFHNHIYIFIWKLYIQSLFFPRLLRAPHSMLFGVIYGQVFLGLCQLRVSLSLSFFSDLIAARVQKKCSASRTCCAALFCAPAATRPWLKKPQTSWTAK